MMLWSRWVRFCGRPFDNRVYAAVRIGIALCILGDLTHLGAAGLLAPLFHTFEHGGLSAFSGGDYALGALGPEGGMIACAVVVACMLALVAGVGVRPAIVLGVLAYAQLGALYPPGDRAIDRLLRTVLLLLLFSGAHQHRSLWRRLRGVPSLPTSPAWPADAIRLLLVIVYLSSGINKLAAMSWLPGKAPPALYRILTDPTAGYLDHVWWSGMDGLFHLGALFTLALELSAPLLLTRLAPWWAIGGVAMHLGIAATMGLGIFPWGMLAIYPILFAPWMSPANEK